MPNNNVLTPADIIRKAETSEAAQKRQAWWRSWRLPFIGAYDERLMDQLNPEAKATYLRDYHKSIKLQPLPKCADTVNGYFNARQSKLASLALNADFADAASLQKSQDLRANFDTIQQHVESIGASYHPDLIRGELQAKRNELLAEIDKQNLKDLEKFANPESDDAEKLKKWQNEQRKELEEKLNKDITTLHNAINAEQSRIAAFAFMRQHSEEMRIRMDNLYNAGGGISAIGDVGKPEMFKDMTLAALMGDQDSATFKMITGQTIVMSKTPNGFQFSIAKEPWNRSAYYRGNQAKTDMMFIAQMVQATGATTIKWTIPQQDSEEIAMIAARKAYEASLQVGFDEMLQSPNEKDANDKPKSSPVTISISYRDKNGDIQKKVINSIDALYNYTPKSQQQQERTTYSKQHEAAERARRIYQRGKNLGGTEAEFKQWLSDHLPNAPDNSVNPHADHRPNAPDNGVNPNANRANAASNARASVTTTREQENTNTYNNPVPGDRWHD